MVRLGLTSSQNPRAAPWVVPNNRSPETSGALLLGSKPRPTSSAQKNKSPPVRRGAFWAPGEGPPELAVLPRAEGQGSDGLAVEQHLAIWNEAGPEGAGRWGDSNAPFRISLVQVQTGESDSPYLAPPVSLLVGFPEIWRTTLQTVDVDEIRSKAPPDAGFPQQNDAIPLSQYQQTLWFQPWLQSGAKWISYIHGTMHEAGTTSQPPEAATKSRTISLFLVLFLFFVFFLGGEGVGCSAKLDEWLATWLPKLARFTLPWWLGNLPHLVSKGTGVQISKPLIQTSHQVRGTSRATVASQSHVGPHLLVLGVGGLGRLPKQLEQKQKLKESQKRGPFHKSREMDGFCLPAGYGVAKQQQKQGGTLGCLFVFICVLDPFASIGLKDDSTASPQGKHLDAESLHSLAGAKPTLTTRSNRRSKKAQMPKERRFVITSSRWALTKPSFQPVFVRGI